MRSNDLRALFRHVLSVSLLAPAAAAGAAACSGATIEPGASSDAGSTGDGATSDAAHDGSAGECLPPNSPRWTKPGCGRPADACFTPDTPEPACFTAVCGCSGKVIGGCGSFTEPYTNVGFDPMNMPAVGSACDPTGGDAGLDASRDVNVPDGCVATPQPVADAGLACTAWDVPLPCSFPEDGSSVGSTLCESYCGPGAMFCSKDATKPILHCDPGCAIGRRPEGFAPNGSSRSGTLATITGEYFAAMTELEAASVFSFERLARELAAHGAPASLVKRARRAADDERRHARVAGALANRFGGEVRLPAEGRSEVRSLEAIALENAVEGCVRETFGALSATLQGDRAPDPRVRAALRRIAVDETSHARLAWDVAAWLETRLGDEAKARVAAASQAAVRELRAEVGREQPDLVRAIVGLPDAAEATRMVDAMSVSLWAA